MKGPQVFHILCAIAHDEDARLVPVAAELARSLDGTLRLLHIEPEGAAPASERVAVAAGSTAFPAPVVTAPAQRPDLAALAGIADECDVHWSYSRADPVRGLIARTAVPGCVGLVLSDRAESPIRALLHGRCSRVVIRRSAVPVLAVPRTTTPQRHPSDVIVHAGCDDVENVIATAGEYACCWRRDISLVAEADHPADHLAHLLGTVRDDVTVRLHEATGADPSTAVIDLLGERPAAIPVVPAPTRNRLRSSLGPTLAEDLLRWGGAPLITVPTAAAA